MKYRLLKWALLLQAGRLAAQGADAPPEAYNSLLTNSPFGPRAAANGAAAASATPLELRSVIVDSGEVLFSLFDTSSRSSRWVGLNEPGNPFTVRSYDSAKGEVKVNYQGRELVLGLKQATIIALAAPPVSAPVPPPTGKPQPAVASTPANDEAVRLAQIAEEIGRRRALRQQARQQSNPGQPPPPSNK